jgi:large subunit ribosomal protein L21
MTYAVIRTGGKQYTVREGATLKVEKLAGEPGDSLDLGEVLMVADGDSVTVGTPTVSGARVVAEIVEHGKGDKIIVFKYKPKIRYRKKTGHRQQYTQLAVKQIVTG